MADNDIDIDDENDEEDDEGQDSSPVRRERPRPSGRQQQGGRSGGGNFRRPMGGFRGRRKVCAFCVDKIKVIDWKNVGNLRRFVDDAGSIRARRKTGTCARHQRRLAVAVKRARHLALLPYTNEHVRLAGKN